VICAAQARRPETIGRRVFSCWADDKSTHRSARPLRYRSCSGMPRAAGRYSGCYVRATVSGDFSDHTLASDAHLHTCGAGTRGLFIVPYSRQHGTDGDRIAADADRQRFIRRCPFLRSTCVQRFLMRGGARAMLQLRRKTRCEFHVPLDDVAIRKTGGSRSGNGLSPML
jgi:hypothetical protein